MVRVMEVEKLKTMLKANIMAIQPHPVIGDEDSNELTEYQLGYKHALSNVLTWIGYNES